MFIAAELEEALGLVGQLLSDRGHHFEVIAIRFDQIHFKLYAAADDRPRGKHHADLERLRPTRDELLAAAR